MVVKRLMNNGFKGKRQVKIQLRLLMKCLVHSCTGSLIKLKLIKKESGTGHTLYAQRQKQMKSVPT